MGLFDKKKKEKEELPSLPSLPSLPRLPDFTSQMEDHSYGPWEEKQIHRLPSFPSSNIGTKFSRDTIKDAVKGDRDNDKFPAAEELEDDIRMARDYPRKIVREEIDEDMDMSIPNLQAPQIRETLPRKSSTEPVFVRIDKFEEAMKIFHDTKRKISDIERVLDDIKRIKAKEDEEIKQWETEVLSIKSQIEKVDRDVFSKI